MAFEERLRIQKTQLENKIQHWNKIKEECAGNISDDGVSLLNSSVGMSGMLIKGRLKQFEAMVIAQRQVLNDQQKILDEDLEGLWDLIQAQVAAIDSQFEELRVLHKNNWHKYSNNKTPLRNVTNKMSSEANIKVVKNMDKSKMMKKTKPLTDIKKGAGRVNGLKEHIMRMRQAMKQPQQSEGSSSATATPPVALSHITVDMVTPLHNTTPVALGSKESSTTQCSTSTGAVVSRRLSNACIQMRVSAVARNSLTPRTGAAGTTGTPPITGAGGDTPTTLPHPAPAPTTTTATTATTTTTSRRRRRTAKKHTDTHKPALPNTSVGGRGEGKENIASNAAEDGSASEQLPSARLTRSKSKDTAAAVEPAAVTTTVDVPRYLTRLQKKLASVSLK